jgi:sugar transferase (PEP-CTERM/EpsH1 system associated)
MSGAPALAAAAAPPLVVHLLDQLDPGTAEQGLLDLIHHMPPGRYRHAIVCLKDAPVQGGWQRRRDVEIVTIGKREGKDPAHYLRLFRVLRALQPDIIHTRNLCGLEAQLIAALAGVKVRVHGEHAPDAPSTDGARLKYQLLRRLLRPLVGHFITVSAELQQWLIEAVGAAPAHVSQIANGVDSTTFHPRLGPPAVVGPPGFMVDHAFVIGSAGEFAERCNAPTLVDAFIRLAHGGSPLHQHLRLLLVGDGPERAACLDQLRLAGLAHRAWLPGRRPDLAQLMRAMDVFVLPAAGEADPAMLLRAMASGLPVVASTAGANAELVCTGFTGILVPSVTGSLLASAIGDYCRLPELAGRHGARARAQVIANHSLPTMAQGYLAIYDALASRARLS